LTGFASGSAVLDLAHDEMVLQLAGDEAVVARVPNYLTDPAFAGMFDANPYHDRSRAVMPAKAAPQRMYTRPAHSGGYRPAIGSVAPDDLLLAGIVGAS